MLNETWYYRDILRTGFCIDFLLDICRGDGGRSRERESSTGCRQSRAVNDGAENCEFNGPEFEPRPHPARVINVNQISTGLRFPARQRRGNSAPGSFLAQDRRSEGPACLWRAAAGRAITSHRAAYMLRRLPDRPGRGNERLHPFQPAPSRHR